MYQIILMKLCLVCMQFKLVFFKLFANSLKHFSGLTLVLYYSQLYVELLFFAEILSLFGSFLK